MKAIKNSLAGVFLISQMTMAIAATIMPALAKDDVCDSYAMVHINGISTGIEDARANQSALEFYFGNSHNQHLMKYGLAYNASDSFSTDVGQLASQLMAEYPGSSYREWLNYLMNGVWPNSAIGQATSEAIGSITEFATNIRRPATYWKTDPDMPRMMSAISQFGNWKRMVLVGHSQGTVYANIIYNILTTTGYLPPGVVAGPGITPFKIPSTQLGLVSVAALVTSVSGGTWVTSTNDAAVDAVRRVVPATRPANITIPYNFAIDAFGHDFRNTYLGTTVGRDAVIKAIENRFNGLKPKFNDIYGTTAGFPGFAAWQKCTQAQPCANNQITGEKVYYATPPTTIYPKTQIVPSVTLSRDGSYSEIEPLARAHSQTCINTLLNNRIKRVTAGGIPTEAVNVPGCSNPNNYGSEEMYAWMLYSVDGYTITTSPSLPIPPESSGYATARVYAYPFCKP